MHRVVRLAAVALLLVLLSAHGAAGAASDREVFLIQEGDRVTASNSRFSRIDTLKLEAGEQVVESHEATLVLLVVTDRRFLAYGAPVAAWQAQRRQAGETLVAARAAAAAATVITSERILNYDALKGVWVAQRR